MNKSFSLFLGWGEEEEEEEESDGGKVRITHPSIQLSLEPLKCFSPEVWGCARGGGKSERQEGGRHACQELCFPLNPSRPISATMPMSKEARRHPHVELHRV